MQPFFSIIIPVFNVEKHLAKCLDSILSQEFKDYELILIDDGSTDSSAAILDHYKQEHAALKIIHQENKGQGEARNLGIKEAQGRFLWFIDSDDWITKDALTFLYDQINDSKESIDGMFFTCNVLEVETDNTSVRTEHHYSGLSEAVEEGDYDSDKLLSMLFSNDIVPLCCTKIFSRAVFLSTGFHFEKGIFFEDIPFNVSLIAGCKRIRIVKKDLYVYNQRLGSTMSSVCTDKHIYSIFISLKAVLAKLHQLDIYEKYERALASFYWYQLTFIYLKFVLSSDKDKYLLYLKELELSTQGLSLNFFIPSESDPEDFYFATLLKSLMEHPAFEEELEGEVFGAFNFPEEFVQQYM